MPKNLEYSLEYTEKARDDVRDIVLWYRSEIEGLEDRFLMSLEASMNSLVKNPLIYQVNFKPIRSLFLQRFPYRVYYFVEGSSIKIIGIIHTKRSPKLIRKRIRR